MTFAEWIQETRRKFRNDPFPIAACGAAQDFWVGALSRGLHVVHSGETEPIWNREFDVCLVIDACRWDLMAEVCATDEYDYLPETPDEIRSVGSMSPEWISNTFDPDYEEQARRAAYVTGNTFSGNESDSWPQLPLDENHLGYLDEAWRTHWEADEDVGVSTVPPEVLTDKAIDVWRRRDELDVDHLVVHYMQPHTPFRSRPEWFEDRGGDQAETATDKDLWKRCRDGELPKDKVWDAYRDNLCWVLDSIDLLLDNCEGTVAITSDHGNGFGEWGVWGHPPGNPLEELRRVPWVTVEGRDHYSYEPTVRGRDRDETGSDAEADIEAQLDALGYR